MPARLRTAGRRAAELAGALVILAGCTTESRSQAAVAIDGGGGDVWAWNVDLRGAATGCRGVSFEVNGSVAATDVQERARRFTARVPLEEGPNEIVAVCAGERSAPVTYAGRLTHRPTARVVPSLDRGLVVLDGSRSREDARDPATIESFRWSVSPDNPAPIRLEPSTDDRPIIRVRPPSEDGEYYVWLEVTDAAGRTDRAGTYFVIEGGRARIPDFRRENPAWVDRAVVYGVIPPLFGSNPLHGVERRLPYLKELGIDALWLSPINGTPPGDFGYAVTDYFAVREDYGTGADLRSLVRTAHRLGIRVLMDFVPNHTSAEHPYFRDAERLGERSHHWDYYDRRADGTPTHYFDWTHLPNLNYENPEVRRFMLAAFSYWVREFDIDGFRVDVAWGVKMRRPDFWPEWRTELKRIKPDLLLLAEASARDGFYFEEGFDVAYDWTEELGHWAWGGAFDAPEVIADWLDRALTAEGRGYHDDALIFRFMNNNDTEIRFVDRYGPDVTKVAAAMLLTLPGVPLVYTGDEIGASYLPYSTLNPLVWSNDRFDLRDYYRRLIALRHDVPALRSRAWQPVATDPGGSVYAYLRWAEDDPLVRFDGGDRGEPVLVILNYRGATAVTVGDDDRIARMTAGGTVVDLLSGRTFAVDPSRPLTVDVPAKSALLLTVPGEAP
ncbi:MAG: alpha-amylase family glycosyl hydrolase [Actinomycetota bacterium]